MQYICILAPFCLKGVYFFGGIGMKKESIQKISVTAVFCALAFLMTVILRFKVGFLTFDFKDAVLAVVSLLYGPLYGIAAVIVVVVSELAISGSDTGFYGLLMNFISSGTFALVCGVIYKYKRNFIGAILSVVFAVLSVTGIMLIANIFITPLYMGVGRSDVVAMIPTTLLPFNLAKSIMNGASLLLIYKPLTTALKKSRLIKTESASYKFSKKSIALAIVSIIIIVVTAIYIIENMNGQFLWHK